MKLAEQRGIKVFDVYDDKDQMMLDFLLYLANIPSREYQSVKEFDLTLSKIGKVLPKITHETFTRWQNSLRALPLFSNTSPTLSADSINVEIVTQGFQSLKDKLPRAYFAEQCHLLKVSIDKIITISQASDESIGADLKKLLSNLTHALNILNLEEKPENQQEYQEHLALVMSILKTVIVLYEKNKPANPNENSSGAFDQIKEIYFSLSKKFHAEIHPKAVTVNAQTSGKILQSVDTYLSKHGVDLNDIVGPKNKTELQVSFRKAKGFFHHNELSDITLDTALYIKNILSNNQQEAHEASSLKQECLALAIINDAIVSREIVRTKVRDTQPNSLFILILLIGLAVLTLALLTGLIGALLGTTVAICEIAFIYGGAYFGTYIMAASSSIAMIGGGSGLALMLCAPLVSLCRWLYALATNPSEGNLLNGVLPTLEAMHLELMQQVATQYKLTENLHANFEPQTMANEKMNEKDISVLVGHLYDP